MGHEARCWRRATGRRPSCSSRRSATASRPPPTARSPRSRPTRRRRCAPSAALRDEEFDVLHLHEPIAPGPTDTAAIVHPAPIVGTFHAAGDSAGYRMLQPVRALDGRAPRRCAAPSRPTPRRWPSATWAAPTRCCSTASSSTGTGAASRRRPSSPTIFFCRSPRAPQGPGGAPRGHAAAPGRRPVVGREQRARHGEAAGHATPAIRRVEWLGRITEAEKAARLRGASVFCAPALGGESFGVVLLEAMAAGTAVVASDIPGYRNVAAPGRDAVLVPPDDPSALAAALQEDPDRRRPGRLRPPCRHGAGRVVLDGPPGRAATSSATSGC